MPSAAKAANIPIRKTLRLCLKLRARREARGAGKKPAYPPYLRAYDVSVSIKGLSRHKRGKKRPIYSTVPLILPYTLQTGFAFVFKFLFLWF